MKSNSKLKYFLVFCKELSALYVEVLYVTLTVMVMEWEWQLKYVQTQ